MIQIQLIQNKTIAQIIKELPNEHQEELNLRFVDEPTYNHFAVYDGELVLGICQFKFVEETKAIVNGIFILPEERKMKFGDGLIRAVLNSIEIRGGKSVIFIANENEKNFYQHMGFAIESLDNLRDKSWVSEVKKHSNSNALMSLESISDFFNKPCKSTLKK